MVPDAENLSAKKMGNTRPKWNFESCPFCLLIFIKEYI